MMITNAERDGKSLMEEQIDSLSKVSESVTTYRQYLEMNRDILYSLESKLLTFKWIINTEVGWIARSDVPSRSVVVDVSKKLEKLGRQQAIQGRTGVTSNFVTHMKVSLIANSNALCSKKKP